MVGLVDGTAREAVGIRHRDDEIRSADPDLARDRATQRNAELDDTVGESVEELHDVDPDPGGAGPLLLLAQRPGLRRRHGVDAGLPARHEQVGHGLARPHPPLDRGGRAVLEVVGCAATQRTVSKVLSSSASSPLRSVMDQI